MKSLLASAAIGLAVCVLAVPAFADDARDALLKAQQAQLAAPLCRMTINSKEADGGATSVVVIETMNPGQMHVRQEQGGRTTLEMFTDGRRTMIRRGNGPMIQAPASVGAMIASVGNSRFLQAMAETAKDVKAAGHEVVNGQAATIYSFRAETMGVHANSKLWVSDKDALPLKAEADSTGDGDFGVAGFGGKTNRHSEISFSYDPSITFVVPLPG